MTSPILAVDKLEVVYQRAITALQGITLTVSAAQIVGAWQSPPAGTVSGARHRPEQVVRLNSNMTSK